MSGEKTVTRELVLAKAREAHDFVIDQLKALWAELVSREEKITKLEAEILQLRGETK